MLRFREFEDLGLALACISDKSDGDLAGTANHGPTVQFCDTHGIQPRALRSVRQVHGNRVVLAGEAADDEEADALVTDRSGYVLTVRVADCVPVFLFDPATRAIGLVHAGWRGTLAGIASAAVQAFVQRFGSSPEDIHALIGPSAGVCCYEVSEELARRFDDAGLAAVHDRVDLPQSNRIQLIQAGLPTASVESIGVCTICDGRFHSYRGDPDAGRNLAVIAL